MNWEAIRAVGEILGAAGVILTLAYLALQLRQNTKAMQSTAELETARHWSEQNIRAALDPDITRIMDVGNWDAGSLNDDERRRFIWFLASHFYMVDGLFKLYKKRQLSEDAWLPIERQIRGAVQKESIKVWLNSGISQLSDSFTQRFDLNTADWHHDGDLARMFDGLKRASD